MSCSLQQIAQTFLEHFYLPWQLYTIPTLGQWVTECHFRQRYFLALHGHDYDHDHDLDHDLDHVIDHLTMIKTMLMALTMTKKRVKNCDVSAVCSIFVQFLRCSLQQIGQICAAAVILLRNQPSLSSYLFVLFWHFFGRYHICCCFFGSFTFFEVQQPSADRADLSCWVLLFCCASAAAVILLRNQPL